jgi:hypothetical protein
MMAQLSGRASLRARFGLRMKKRSAEKVIARSILALATYRKTTMARALRKRPRFWTVPRPEGQGMAEPPRKRLRMQFSATGGGFSMDTSAIAPLEAEAAATPG